MKRGGKYFYWLLFFVKKKPEYLFISSDNLAAKRSADEPLSGGASPKNARIAPGSPQSRSASLGDFHAAAVSDATPSGLSSLINFNTSSSEPSKSPTLTDEKKSRREIANCNERRRMQSINDGFARLKSLVPCIANEKVSKVTILLCQLRTARDTYS